MVDVAAALACSGDMYAGVPMTMPVPGPGPADVAAGWLACGSASLAMPKSRTLATSGVGDHDVGGLEVAMDDAALVRGAQGIGDLRQSRLTARARCTSGDSCCFSRSVRVVPPRNSIDEIDHLPSPVRGPPWMTP